MSKGTCRRLMMGYEVHEKKQPVSRSNPRSQGGQFLPGPTPSLPAGLCAGILLAKLSRNPAVVLLVFTGGGTHSPRPGEAAGSTAGLSACKGRSLAGRR